jgi:retron-type reverse transcriptase
LDPYQSGFPTGHSTETALLKINNDIMLILDKNCRTLLPLLDLSAAFDTLDHSLLLQILKAEFGLDGVVLEWFSSYLSQRSFAVFTKTHESTSHPITSGVPQGTVLDPVLFTLCMTPLTKIFNKWNVLYHLYADDTQVYLEYDTLLESNLDGKSNTLSSCLAEVGSWMRSHGLVLN